MQHDILVFSQRLIHMLRIDEGFGHRASSGAKVFVYVNNYNERVLLFILLTFGLCVVVFFRTRFVVWTLCAPLGFVHLAGC